MYEPGKEPILNGINMDKTAKGWIGLDKEEHDLEVEGVVDEGTLTNLPELIFLLDDELHIRWANEEVSTFFDIPREKMIGMDFIDALDSQAKSIEEDELRADLRSQDDEGIKVILSDGKRCTVRSHTFFSTSEELEGVLAVLFLVDEKLEDPLEDDIYRKLFEKDPLPRLLVDPIDRSILEFNESLTEFLGYLEEELCDMKITDLIESASSIDLMDMYGSISEKRDHKIERKVKSKGDEIKRVHLNYMPIIYSGKFVVYIEIIHPDEEEIGKPNDQDLNPLLIVIRNINQLMSRCEDFTYLVQSSCEMLYDIGGIKDVSVGLYQGDDEITPVGHSGDNNTIKWAEDRDLGGEDPEWFESILESRATETIEADEERCKICGMDPSERHRAIIVPLKDEEIIGFMTVCIEGLQHAEDIDNYLLSSIPSTLLYARDKIKSAEERDRFKQKCKSLLNINPHPLLVIDNRGIITQINDAFHEEVGLDKGEIVGKRLSETDFLTIDGKNRILSAFLDKKDGGSESPIIDVKTEEGDVRSFEVNSKLLKDEGRILGAVELFRKLED